MKRSFGTLLFLSCCLVLQHHFSLTEVWAESGATGHCLMSESLELRPQGPPAEADGLHNTFGFLNEQVIWIKHKDSPGRSALRVPEFVRWKGWSRPTQARGYQVGQKWQQDEKSLFFEDCPINYPRSPGILSARVELIDREIVRVSMIVENRQDEPLEEVSCHLCWNHFRHRPLGEDIRARVGESWVDFAVYVTRPPYRNFYFDRPPGTQPGPDITLRALFTEYEPSGRKFSAFIAAPTARTLMSNANWPCTDLTVDFGTIEAGERSSRQVFLGMGSYDREHWLEVVKNLPAE